jgi:predicted metal-dependent HD superfamily phosphohydrolase
LTLDERILQNIHEGWVDQIVLSSDREDILALDDLLQSVKDDKINEESVFNHLVQESKTEHYHNLRYLSARQSIDLQKLLNNW